MPGTSSKPPFSHLHRYASIFKYFEAFADGITVVTAVFGGYFFYHWLQIGKKIDYPLHILWFVSLTISVLYVILLDRDGAYRPGASLLRIKETERALRVSVQTFLLALPVTFFSQYQFSRWVFLIALAFVPLMLVVEKQLLSAAVRALRARGFGVKRVLIYGGGSSGRRVYSALARSPKLGLNPIALVDDNLELAGLEVFESAYRHEHSVRIIFGPITEDFLKQHQCDFLIIAIPSLGRERFANAVQAAHNADIQIAFVPGHAMDFDFWTEEADIDGLMLSLVGQPARDWRYEAAKRPFDLVASFLLIVALSPVWIVISLLVRFDSPGPVLFWQQRAGRNGKLFNLYKFRTMNVDAPKYSFSPKLKVDPRITRVGRFLRRTSLDELAQLLNVLKGDMSLVGPRPEMQFIVENYSPVQRQRLEVTPGITGLWQLSADRAFLIHQNIQYDLYYIRHRSFFMDFAILLHTFVFAMHGV